VGGREVSLVHGIHLVLQRACVRACVVHHVSDWMDSGHCDVRSVISLFAARCYASAACVVMQCLSVGVSV